MTSLKTPGAARLDHGLPAPNLYVAPQPRLAYLIAKYPAVSHTFIYREIAALRECGATVETSSMNSPDRPVTQLPEGERIEASQVFYIKKASLLRVASAHMGALVRVPRGFFRGLRLALSHGGMNAKQLIRWSAYFAEAVIVGDWLRTRGFGHLHVHFATEVGNVGYLAACIFGIELSMTVHGPDEFYDVSRYIIKHKVEAATMVCCISYFTRSQLMKLTSPDQWHKLHVARLGVDITEFTPQPFRVSPDVCELLCVGRLVPAKGQHILLKAIGELSALGYNIRLRLVGDGPDRASLENYCREHGLVNQVVFEGAVNQDRVSHYIRNADLFVLASFAEGIPVALMEAMASEVACVATAITGIPELIRDDVDGLLVPPSDERALTEAIAALLDDPILRRRLAKAGRVRVAEKFEMRRNVRRLRNLFCEHIPSQRARQQAI